MPKLLILAAILIFTVAFILFGNYMGWFPENISLPAMPGWNSISFDKLIPDLSKLNIIPFSVSPAIGSTDICSIVNNKFPATDSIYYKGYTCYKDNRLVQCSNQTGRICTKWL